MIETIYTELPFEKIDYLDRPEFHNNEKEFKEAFNPVHEKIWHERSCVLLGEW